MSHSGHRKWRRNSTRRRCRNARTSATSGTPISLTPSRAILLIAALRCGVLLVRHTCYASVRFTMTCQGTLAALVTCLVVAGVEKPNVLSFVLPLRSFAALEPLWHPLVFFFKMSSRFRRRSVTTASLDLWFASAKWLAYSPSLHVSSALMSFLKLLSCSLV